MQRLILSLALAAAALPPLTATAESRWERREEHWEHREEHWEQWENRSAGSRWDRSRHNGYYYNNRWFYGPPPPAYFGDPFYRPGYTAWRRGTSLPAIYREFVVSDYERYRLRPPPRGFVWYRVGDTFLLTGAGGMIFEIVPY